MYFSIFKKCFANIYEISFMYSLVLSLEGRAAHLASLVQEAEHRIAELVAQVTGEEPGEREESNRERQLKTWEWKLRLYKRMQTGYTHASE